MGRFKDSLNEESSIFIKGENTRGKEVTLKFEPTKRDDVVKYKGERWKIKKEGKYLTVSRIVRTVGTKDITGAGRKGRQFVKVLLKYAEIVNSKG